MATYTTTCPAPTGSEVLTENAKTVANWTALADTIGTDHNSMGTTKDGQHSKITLYQTTKPSAAGTLKTGYFYTKAVDTATEAFYEDAAGTEVQLTNSGSINSFIKAFIYFNSAGKGQGTALNATSVRNATGDYTITFDTDLDDENYVATVTPQSNVGRERAVDIQTKTKSILQVRCFISSDKMPKAVDTAMNITVMST